MVDDSELAGMTYYELRGVRSDAGLDDEWQDVENLPDTDEPSDGNDSLDMKAQVYFRLESSKEVAEVRQRLQIYAEDARFTVDVGMTFAFPGPIEVGQSVRQEFIERVGLMALHPYVRESLQSLSMKLEVEPVLLPLRKKFDLEPLDPAESAIRLPAAQNG
ncbi:hypothetical protein [Pseudarthrobacter sp. NIBRBAC000502771]|uniref:hypothetical protein n=1 Tax=Pseudarthrobacter sp. NIBRBAC000502771 TaxID=2590774 RepID=UPI001132680C|nr:hypothetical protein [Pseudarthrobacter sp. NIBRBAC000502771]QDG63303.1 hypothetical protein NIBR502771_13900 [Pseudarthrobacter sp. NIBRBAC000502771]